MNALALTSDTITITAIDAVQPKPLTNAQLSRKCERMARRLQNKAWSTASDERKAWGIANALLNAAVCYLAAAEKGNKRAKLDARDGGVALAKAIRMAGGDAGMADAVKMLGVAS